MIIGGKTFFRLFWFSLNLILHDYDLYPFLIKFYDFDEMKVINPRLESIN